MADQDGQELVVRNLGLEQKGGTTLHNRGAPGELRARIVGGVGWVYRTESICTG